MHSKDNSKPRRPEVDSAERAIQLVGDRWVLMILREIYYGNHRFDHFQRKLSIATNVLANRLQHMVANDILDRERDPGDGRKVIYSLTERGRDLYGLMLTLVGWGDRWLSEPSGPPMTFTHTTCGNELHTKVVCESCNETVAANEVSFETK